MGKPNKLMDTVHEMEVSAGRLFERISRMQVNIEATLKDVRRLEATLRDKEKAEEMERVAREKQERLMRILSMEGDLAAHVGGDDKEEETKVNEPSNEEPATTAEVVKTIDEVAAPSVENKPPIPVEIKTDISPATNTTAPANHEGRVSHGSNAVSENARNQRGSHRNNDKPSSPVAEQRQRLQGNSETSSSKGQKPAPRMQQSRPSGTAASQFQPSKERSVSSDANKSRFSESDNRAKNKKARMREAAPTIAWDDDTPAMGNRRKVRKQVAQVAHKPEPVVIDKAIITTETIIIKDFSEKIGKPVSEIIKKLFNLGVLANINQEIDFDTAEIIASDYNITLELQLTKTFEDVLSESADDTEDDSTLLEPRPPVVTIMGHVDHGKTSLLDAIRNSRVMDGEAGGITQHIGAYMVSCNDRLITFIDTPGHEAFTSMRARGAQITDIVILVVAADDGIMPQTIEAINHSKAAGVPIIVAINKIDKDTADPERIKQQLTEHGLVCEEWGGDTICVNVSAKKHMGLDSLLEMVLLQADVMELKANPSRLAKGTIIEAELHKGKGPVATVLVQNGTLHVGDTIVAGTAYGRVRAMMDYNGARVDEAGSSHPVQVLGFSEVPSAGDMLMVAEIDKLSRQVAEERRDKQKAAQLKNLSKVSLDDLFNQISEGQMKELNVIVKADVQGSVEAVKQALEKLTNDEVRVRCIHGGVGAISSTDIVFASASNAIVIGFNVRPDATARAAAEREKVDMRMYSIIYNVIEDIEKAMRGLFAPQFVEVTLGEISVRDVFKVSGVGTIAGAYVRDGKVTRNAQVRVVRDGIVIFEGKISSLKRFKDDVREVATGYECGIGIENFNDIHEGDIIEAYIIEEVKR